MHKHIFLVQRAFSLGIYFDTRAGEYEVEEQLLVYSLSELPIFGDKVLEVPADWAVLLTYEQVNSTLSYFKSVNNPK